MLHLQSVSLFEQPVSDLVWANHGLRALLECAVNVKFCEVSESGAKIQYETRTVRLHKGFIMTRQTVIACLAAMLLVGCASVPPAEQLNREMVGTSGKSPLFTSGYRDGCQSGLSAGGNRAFAYAKDLSKANVPDYKLGWEDGFRICQSRQVQRNNERNSNSYDGFGYPYPWFPRTGINIGVEL